MIMVTRGNRSDTSAMPLYTVATGSTLNKE
ncbi:hypothetical protein QF008_003503 [Pseudomonas protegens]|nr:hypothetical protein [Pseudomonas protegens]